jgi:hypothetical protein
MKKTIQLIALACVILAILSVVLAIFTATIPTANTLTQPKNNAETSLEEAAQTNEVQLLSAPEELSAPEDTGAYFTGVSISPLQTQFTIKGEVYDIPTDSPLAGLNVQIYCNNIKILDDFKTDDNGRFSIKGSYDDCGLGSPVVLNVNYNNQDYDTSLDIPDVVFMSLSSSSGSSSSDSISSFSSFSQRIPGVPEFPLATMGLAILGVGLGLAFLRKQ